MALRYSEAISQQFAARSLFLFLSFSVLEKDKNFNSLALYPLKVLELVWVLNCLVLKQTMWLSAATFHRRGPSKFQPQSLRRRESKESPYPPNSLRHFPFTHCLVSSPWPEMSSRHSKIVLFCFLHLPYLLFLEFLHAVKLKFIFGVQFMIKHISSH